MSSLVRCPAPCGGEVCVWNWLGHIAVAKKVWVATTLKGCVAQFCCPCEPRCHGNWGSWRNSYKSSDMLSSILPSMPVVTCPLSRAFVLLESRTRLHVFFLGWPAGLQANFWSLECIKSCFVCQSQSLSSQFLHVSTCCRPRPAATEMPPLKPS